ncbi:DEAD/DEAH box helicase [Candidatus Woesearchaeota archaeon]|nr:DEAD/DEAH box helicase [Candidatus Woesearchaeota archaeon]
MKYNELGIQPQLLKAVQELGFEEPTEIQEKAIPLIQKGYDVIGQSETGSGKTAAFGLPILEKIDPAKGLQAIILAPTRELAEQIKKNLVAFSRYKRVFITSIYGGVSMNPQIDNIRRANIIVGTPGRVLDHLGRRTLNLSRISFFVLDEADKMFDMGFIDDVKQILSYTNQDRQTLMFSATISTEVHFIAQRYMRDPHKIKTKEYVSQQLLKQVMYQVRKQEKFSFLVHLIRQENPKLAIVFCGTRREVDFVTKNLANQGINAMALHGGLSQHRRNEIMEEVHGHNVHILVATDVAARGIDIKDLTHIYNYSIPKTSKEYIHRIGRTARMGDKGLAINLLDERDHDNMRSVLSDHAINIESLRTPEFPMVRVQQPFHRPMAVHRQHGYGGHSRHGPPRGGRRFHSRY